MTSHVTVHDVDGDEDIETDLVPWYKQPLPLGTQVMRFILLLLLTVMFLGVAILVANARMPDPKKVRPLPDLLLEWIPKVTLVENGSNVIIFLLNATTVVVGFKVFLLERHMNGLPSVTFLVGIPKIGSFLNRIAFGVVDSGRRPFPLKNVFPIMTIRFLTSYAVVMVFRTFVIMGTSYPATDNHCQNPQVIEHPVLNVILTLVTLSSGAIHCGDLMFSGHTMILSLAFILAWDYSPFLHPWAVRVWVSALLPISYYCILASRSHYTDDILVAMYVMIATYKLIDHAETGAPWQMQLLIRWMPWPGTNAIEEKWAAEEVVVVVQTPAEDSTDASAAVPEHENPIKETLPAQTATGGSSSSGTPLLRMHDSPSIGHLHSGPPLCFGNTFIRRVRPRRQIRTAASPSGSRPSARHSPTHGGRGRFGHEGGVNGPPAVGAGTVPPRGGTAKQPPPGYFDGSCNVPASLGRVVNSSHCGGGGPVVDELVEHQRNAPDCPFVVCCIEVSEREDRMQHRWVSERELPVLPGRS
ncbi:PAP2 C-terminal family protein [Leishmania donovani]|uniref:PAP2 C-terminal family protein n=1 Tax=Leishmania donovani TaxID=5661 RepID=A0A504X6Y8_LEIDO|nr:PAP2 C-terminal family protein [Leishmania donovani]